MGQRVVHSLLLLRLLLLCFPKSSDTVTSTITSITFWSQENTGEAHGSGSGSGGGGGASISGRSCRKMTMNLASCDVYMEKRESRD